MQNSGRLSHCDDADPRRARDPKQDEASNHAQVPSQKLCDTMIKVGDTYVI